MQNLEEILLEAGSLKCFLSDRGLVNRYFQSCQNYYGADRFSRAPYDKILEQLQSVLKKVPELESRLWSGEGLGDPFSVRAAARSRGRGLNPDTWKRYLDQWRKRLEKTGGEFLRGDWEQVRPKIEDRLDVIREEYDRAGRSVQSERKKARVEKTSRFFKNLGGSQEFRSIAAAMLWRYLEYYSTAVIVESGDADLIIDEIVSLRKRPQELMRRLGFVRHQGYMGLGSQIRKEIPTLSELLKKSGAFPSLTAETRLGDPKPIGGGAQVQYDFRPIPRRFHGIFKGLPIRECVGGDSNWLEELHPSRWATVALENSELVCVEIPSRKARFQGFIHVVPVSDGMRTYGAVEFQAPCLRKTILVSRPSGRAKYSAPLFQLWLAEASRKSKKHWSGYVSGCSGLMDSSASKEVLFQSANYVMGSDIGDARNFSLVDPLAPALARSLKSSEKTAKYCRSSDEMICDVTLRDSQMLRLLRII